MDPWLIAVRENHLAALKTGVDAMMQVQAGRFAARGVKKLNSQCNGARP